VLFEALDPATPVSRPADPFLRPTAPEETTGQVDSVCFAQALVRHQDRWLLYYGMADSLIGCASAPVSP
jgi:predicted GH43/DUF377 family glycosyl hydrolase